MRMHMEARCNSCILSFARSAYSDRERERGGKRERGGRMERERDRNGRRSNGGREKESKKGRERERHRCGEMGRLDFRIEGQYRKFDDLFQNKKFHGYRKNFLYYV